MEPTRRDQVGQGGGPAAGSGDDVVDVADAGGLVAAGEGAVRVAGGDRPAQVGGDGFGGGADVQRQADGAERGAVQGGAEPGGQTAGAGEGVGGAGRGAGRAGGGEGVGGEGEQRPAQPVAGGRAERLAPGGGRRAGGRPAGWCPAAGGGAAAGAAGPRGVLGTGLLSAIGRRCRRGGARSWAGGCRDGGRPRGWCWPGTRR